jgi:VIT1/CCC1 family predicted Fe2+/Mn2+ transporter
MKFRNVSFGATSAVMTGVAIIIGLSGTVNAKMNIIIALLIIAVADNVTDSFGIHIHQESQSAPAKEVRRTTFMNFLARLLITAIFIFFIVLLPLGLAMVLSIILGLSVIVSLSYVISIHRKVSPYRVILQHLLLAVIVIVVSFLLRDVISDLTTTIVT